MTRLEAIKVVRSGQYLETYFYPDTSGVVQTVQVWIGYEPGACRGFSKRRLFEHTDYGPIHVRLWSVGYPDWVHINPKQLLSFIRRNYPRK
jgi:hypothetical protein